MTEQFTVSQELPADARNGTLTVPQLYLSSAQAGWEGLVAEAFNEPMELEGWITPVMSDIALILFSGGAMRIDQRYDYGSWKSLHLRQHDLILSPGVTTPYEVRWQNVSSLPTRTLHLHLDRDLLARTAEEIGGYDPDRLLLRERSGFQDPLLLQIGLSLWRELEQDVPAGKLYAQTAAQMLAIHLLRHYTSAGRPIKPSSQRLTQQQMQRVRDYIHEHLGQELSLELLAQQAGFSPYHFARLFRLTTGESPHQFVQRLRIERAQQLLTGTPLPLAQIALESGFASQSHFTQVFKRQLGLTPRSYRQDYTI